MVRKARLPLRVKTSKYSITPISTHTKVRDESD
jgi:hypothetical protein